MDSSTKSLIRPKNGNIYGGFIAPRWIAQAARNATTDGSTEPHTSPNYLDIRGTVSTISDPISKLCCITRIGTHGVREQDKSSLGQGESIGATFRGVGRTNGREHREEEDHPSYDVGYGEDAREAYQFAFKALFSSVMALFLRGIALTGSGAVILC